MKADMLPRHFPESYASVKNWLKGVRPSPPELPIKLGASLAKSLDWPAMSMTARNTTVDGLGCTVI